MRVLVIKLSSLGDVVHTLPALTDALAALPDLKVDWAVEESFVDIPHMHPAVKRVIPVAIRRWRKRPVHSYFGDQWRLTRRELKRESYDAVIDAQGLIKTALLCRVVSGPRYGLDRNSVRERMASAAYHHRIAVPKEMHAVERTRLLFARALNYALPTSAGDYSLALLNETLVQESSPTILFFHGTARPEKLWSESNWIELALKANANNYRVLLPWGSEEERHRAQRIAAGAGGGQQAQVLPPLGISDLTAVMRQSQGAVAVDTGLSHLAAAMSLPCVALYGPTRPALVGTYGRNQEHVKAADDVVTKRSQDMMRMINTEDVWQRLQALLASADYTVPNR